MITDCFSIGHEILDLNETAFFQDTLALLVIVAPGALCFTLWRIFVTNKSGPRGGIVVLGLDASSSIYSDLLSSGVSNYLRLSYCVMSILTFTIGLLASAGFNFCMRALFD
jgi:hypothetical protein